MATYVDELFCLRSRNPQAFRIGERNGHKWCHLFADPEDLEGLHEMARRIGMRRDWFQPKAGFPHYDLTPGKRELAVKLGAYELTHRQVYDIRRLLWGTSK